jgi:hypothetical protein
VHSDTMEEAVDLTSKLDAAATKLLANLHVRVFMSTTINVAFMEGLLPSGLITATVQLPQGHTTGKFIARKMIAPEDQKLLQRA